MTDRPFLFLSGESQVSMPLVFSREHWQHTMSCRLLVKVDSTTIRRDNVPEERIKGVVYFASVDNEQTRRENLALLARMGIPCWPDPARLLEIDDRRELLWECVEADLVDHWVRIVSNHESLTKPDLFLGNLPRPYVVKTGNLHRGEGKHLVREGDPVPCWDPAEGSATVEPFFEGTSCRVLIIGGGRGTAFPLRYDNPTTWIKNVAGADVELWPDMPREVFEHARKVHDHFDLDISGIDYIVGPKGDVHFLELNQFPGVGATEEIEACARAFFAKKMDEVERGAATS